MNFKIIAFLALILSAHAGLCQSLTYSRHDSLKGTLNPLRSCYDVHYYELSVRVDIDKKQIAGISNIHYEAREDCSKLQLDLFRNLTIDSIVDHGRLLHFERDSNVLFVSFPALQLKGSHHILQIHYHGSPIEARKAPWDGGFVWARDSTGAPWVGVACEGEGASLWWPCKDHPSDEPDSLRINITVPENLQCVSNGTLEKITGINHTRTFFWHVSYPINVYNVTLNIGNYAHFSDTLARKDASALALDYYVLQYNLARAKKHFSQVKTILPVYEYFFGPYPFPRDGYALVETPYLGMEHQSAIAYGNNYKNDLGEFDFIIVHETAHEWWGNSLSAADKGELWIHESFATYAESLLIEQVYGKESAIRYLNQQKTHINNKQPVLLPRNVGFFYPEDTDIYYKGAWMLHTIRNIIGNDEAFFKILLELAQQYKHSIVTTENIVSAFNRFPGLNLPAIFDLYLNSTRVPVLKYHIKKKGRKTEILYKWDIPALTMPVYIQTGDKMICLRATDNLQKEILITDCEIRIMTELEYIKAEKTDF